MRSLYKIRKEKAQLERKLDRLADPVKVKQTLLKIRDLENEEAERLRHWGGGDK